MKSFTVLTTLMNCIRLFQRLSAEAFRFLRIEMNLSQKVLGEQLGVDTQTVARWEKAQTTISRLADVVLRALYLEIENKDSHVTEMLAMLSDAEVAGCPKSSFQPPILH